jgi:hypothetical protein
VRVLDMNRLPFPVVLVLLLTPLISAGCGDSSEAPDPESTVSGGTGVSDRCDKKLAAAMQRLQPTAMATQTRTDLVVNSLNSWLTECVSDRVSALKVGAGTQSVLSPTAVRFATAGRFTLNDATYIRDSLLLNKLTERVWKRADSASDTGIATESQRVVQLFRAINQLVTLLPATDDRVPIGLYETLLTGRGSTDDRIWLFAEALRQRQIDAVLLECRSDAVVSDANGASSPLDAANLLVAVLAEPDVLLFDPVRVTAIPKPDDESQLISEPAGMPELTASERWKDCRVRMIDQPATSAPRMLVLQENLTADDPAMLFDEVGGGTSELIAQRDRIVKSGDGFWHADAISVWSYPEQRNAEASGLTEEQRRAYQRLMKPFDAPFELDPMKSGDSLDDIDVGSEELSPEQRMQLMEARLQERIARMNESSEEMFGKASQRLLKVRIDQVMGDSELGVIQQLQQIRVASMHDFVEIQVRIGKGETDTGMVQLPLPDAIRAIHRSATGNALFWSAMCQIDRGDDGAAVITLRNYRTQYPAGVQTIASLVQEALALLRLGARESAVEVLRSIELTNAPERARIEWLLGRLDPQPGASNEPAGDPSVPDETESATDSNGTKADAVDPDPAAKPS